MLVTFQTEVYHDGNVRMQLMREDIPISKRLRMAFMVNTDKEYMQNNKLSKYWKLRTLRNEYYIDYYPKDNNKYLELVKH